MTTKQRASKKNRTRSDPRAFMDRDDRADEPEDSLDNRNAPAQTAPVNPDKQRFTLNRAA